jgi:GNAT superfamily N-acetyltransferase
MVEQTLGFSSVTVAVERDAPSSARPGSIAVIGFFSLSPTSIRVAEPLLTKLGLPAVPYPTLGGFLLGRLGVQEESQGKGIGAALVAVAIEYAETGRLGVGGAFVALDAEEEELVPFYTRLGFDRLYPGKLRMIMGI